MKRGINRMLTLMLSAMLSLQGPVASIAETVQETDAVIVVEDIQSEDLVEEKVEDILEEATKEVVELTGQVSISDNQVQPITDQKDEIAPLAKTEVGYVYLEKVSLTQNEENRMVVSLQNESATVEEVSLVLEGEKEGKVYTLSNIDQSEDAYAFSTNEVSLGKGIYRVTKLLVQLLDSTGMERVEELPLETMEGMEQIVFGVEEDPGYEQDKMLTIEEMSGQTNTELTREAALLDEEMADLVQIDVQDLSGASDQITKKLLLAKNSEEELSIERGLGAPAGYVRIFLDAGHDQTHAGARANGLNEEVLTLKVAQYCRDYLLSTYSNVQVMMCRESGACPHPGTDSGTDNRSRVADAQNWGADAYVSIHFNSAAASAQGAMVFYPNSNYNAAVGNSGSILATKILEQLTQLGLVNKGIHIRNSESRDTYDDGSLADYYAVIRAAKKAGIPGIIVEHAFLTNAQDAAFLKSEENLKRLGYADARGIANAYNLSTEPIEYSAKSIEVTDIDGVNGSFKMTVKGVKPVDYIDTIKFKVYPTSDTKESYVYTANQDSKTKTTFSATGGVMNHGGVTGAYKVIAYACDALDRRTKIASTTFTIEPEKVDPSQVNLVVKQTRDQKKTTLYLTGNDGAAEVTYKVYHIETGTKSMKTYPAEKTDAGWKIVVPTKQLGYHGQYKVAVYSKNYYGTKKKIRTGTFEIDLPTVKSISVHGLNFDQGTFQLRANKVSAKAGVKKVQLKVRNLTGKKKTKIYDAKNKASFSFARIDMKDFAYQLGKYEFSVLVTDGNGITSVVRSEKYDLSMPDTQVSAVLKKQETRLVLSAKNLGIGSNIKGVRFRVWRVGGGVKTRYYDAAYKNGAYSVITKVSDFGTAGTYKMQAYTKDAKGKYLKAGKQVRFRISDIQNGKISIKKKNDTSSYFFVDSISANSTISKVEVKAWPTTKSSAKYTYVAQQLSNGRFRAVIDQKKHQGRGGNYRYEVRVTLKNNVTKLLLKGKFPMGEDSGEVEEDDPFETENGLHIITGSNGVTIDQMVAYYQAHTVYPSFYKNSDAPTIRKFCTIYYNECKAENIRVEVAFVQAMKETNFLRYTGDVKIGQFNFAGIGATGGGVPGNSFSSVTVGVRAQIQHLKAYANSEPLNKACVDPRFQYVSRGNAPYVEWLGIPDNPYGKGWATAQNYGSSILTMIELLKSY